MTGRDPRQDGYDREPRPARTLSLRAQATRSFRLAMQQTGEARDRALGAHFEEFAPARSCPLRRV